MTATVARHRWSLALLLLALDWAGQSWLGTAYGVRPYLLLSGLALGWRAPAATRWTILLPPLLLGAAGELWRRVPESQVIAGVVVALGFLLLADALRALNWAWVRRLGLAALGLAVVLLPLGQWIRAVDWGPERSVAVLSSVPLGPIADPAGRNDALMTALERVGPVTLLDRVDDAGPDADRLLLLQPPALPPAQLVAIDSWVRRGGGAVVLADPELHWAGDRPLGDPAGPLRASLLDPLLEHWGVRLELDTPGTGRRNALGLPSPGWLQPLSTACEPSPDARVSQCRVGRGRALVVADADWADPAGWARAIQRPGEIATALRSLHLRPARELPIWGPAILALLTLLAELARGGSGTGPERRRTSG